MDPENEDLSRELEAELEAHANAGEAGGQGGAEGAGSAESGGASAPQAKPEDEGLLGVVRDAAPARKPDAAAASPADGAETGQQPGDGAPKQPDNENYSDVPFNKHPRFRQLLSERNANKTDAERYRQVDTFIRDHGMSAQEAADLLTVGAMAKTNPAKAWELARPWVENLLKACGEVLSPDLQQAVQEGRMTMEAAYEVSRSRASVASMEASRTFESERREQQARDEQARSITAAAEEWENDRRAKDPNYDAKLEQIHREIAWRHHNGDRPKTAAEVKAQLDDAYKVVNAALQPPAAPGAPGRQAAPRNAVKPVTGGSVAGGNAKPAPRSMLEVVQQAVG
ncbi:hypothetical protein [Methylobacterium brachiatum]|uniref:hypothetical protein n=1 Tax=Methylobacterium brachiatum TaxID=269660 RepID=UPI0008E4989A|nr:hypothetical protein [Methylobacterium brachiatum]SFI05646.1 hypothetical protein SAMN02799642_00571 [Methylobacterium brachiatum]